MKRFIRSLENDFISLVCLAVGILMTIFPVHFSIAFPWVLGGALVLRGAAVVILAMRYKDAEHGPGYVVLYCVMGATIMILGTDATGIIGVIWAVFTLVEVSTELDEMWREKQFSFVYLIPAIVSVVLAVGLMVDPFEHFVTHVRVLGLEIISSCFGRGVDIVKEKRNDRSAHKDHSISKGPS